MTRDVFPPLRVAFVWVMRVWIVAGWLIFVPLALYMIGG